MINKNKGEASSASEHQIKQQAWHKEEPQYIVSVALGDKGDEEGECEVVKRRLANKVENHKPNKYEFYPNINKLYYI